MRERLLPLLLATALAVTFAGVARSAEIAPGQRMGVPESDALPAGTKVAEKVIPYMLNWAQPGDAGGLSDLDANGTLTTSVYRDSATGFLSFVYDIFLEPTGRIDHPPETYRPHATELSRLTAGDFAGFRTDLSGNFGDRGSAGEGDEFSAARSANGSTVSGFREQGLGRPPLLIVNTNATAFNDVGTARFDAGAEFLVRPENDFTYRQASATLAGTFQPVPEPASAGVALAAMALLARRGPCRTLGTRR